MTIATSFRQCETCKTRVLLIRGFPPLNYQPDAAGTVAVSFTHPRTSRFLAKGEALGPFEHRHSVHECQAVAEPELPGTRPGEQQETP